MPQFMRMVLFLFVNLFGGKRKFSPSHFCATIDGTLHKLVEEGSNLQGGQHQFYKL